MSGSTILPADLCYSELCRIAFERNELSISEQKADLRNLRNQASVVIAINGLIAGISFNVVRFFLASTFGFGEMADIQLVECFCFLMAASVFMGSLVAGAMVILKSNGWKFDVGATKLLEKYEASTQELPVSELHRKLATVREKNRISNENLFFKTTG